MASMAACTVLLMPCTEAVQVGQNLGEAGAPAALGLGASGGDAAGVQLTPGAVECTPRACGSSIQECGDCLDDDADGLVDASDPECLGPCDDSEAELFTGVITRVNGSCNADCYFDRNSGGGDDGCAWSYRCDPLAVAPDFPPTGLDRCSYDSSPNPACELDADERADCEQGCLPLTPNGCDCFGCCELPAASGRFVWLGSENLDASQCEPGTGSEPASCQPCTPVPGCQNDCAECEFCVGKTTLPASCSLGGNARPNCENGLRGCDPASETDCSISEYCITGCCVPLPR